MFKRFGRKSTDKRPSTGVSLSFNLLKVNKQGKRQNRTLVVSKDGVKNMNGNACQWEIEGGDVHGISRVENGNKKTICLSVLHHYTFEANTEAEAERIIEAFRLLGLIDEPGPSVDGRRRNSSLISNASQPLDIPAVSVERPSIGDEANGFDVGVGKKVTAEDFEMLKLIGLGSFGKVFLVRKIDDEKIYAMKVLDKQDLERKEQMENVLSERKALVALNHPLIIQLFYSFQTQDNLYFVMDFAAGGELSYHLKRLGHFSEDTARFYAAQLVHVLDYLHTQGIMYRDLKLENVMIDATGNIKVTDFGLAKKGLETSTFCGTPEYLAPEIVKGEGYTKSAEFWSLGVVLYEMLAGERPFQSPTRAELYDRVLNSSVEMRSHFSADASSLIAGLMCRNPSDRLGSGPSGIDELKTHTFFKNIDWDALANLELPPPIKPQLQSDVDTTNFDEGLTGETANNFFGVTNEISSSFDPGDAFASPRIENFTYQHDSPLLERATGRGSRIWQRTVK